MDTIQQHLTKQLGKRCKPERSESEMKVEQAVEIMINKRRRTCTKEARPLSLSEMRAEEKACISRLAKQHRKNLVQFHDIMQAAMETEWWATFESLANTPDFTDGFLLRLGSYASGWALHRFLIEQGLDVNWPYSHGKAGHQFFQLRSGPYGIEHNLGVLRGAVQEMRK